MYHAPCVLWVNPYLVNLVNVDICVCNAQHRLKKSDIFVDLYVGV